MNLPGLAPITNALHRVIRMTSRCTSNGGSEIRTAIEDDFHHFRVAILHDGTHITGFATDSNRAPYTLCKSAGERLQELVGMPLHTSVTAIFRQANARLQCTHQFDIAASAIAASARGIVQRRTDIVIPDRVDDRTDATLSHDGKVVLRWSIEGETIVAPEPFTGRSTITGFTDWADKTLDADAAEAALMLRRAVFISRGGRVNARFERPHAMATLGCWAKQPERNQMALEFVGSRRNFALSPIRPTAGDEAWLAFEEEESESRISPGLVYSGGKEKGNGIGPVFS